jgi:non-ribosomal peptide synthetase component F
MAFTLHQLLTETAARQPEHEARRLLNEALTYGQLDRLSKQVAHSLIANGVTHGDRVGFYLYKSPAAIAAILWNHEDRGVLCAGGANAPDPRLEEIGRQRWRSCRRAGDSKSAIAPPFAGFSLPVKFFRPTTCGR